MNDLQIDLVPVRGEYRLAYRGTPIGSEQYNGSAVLCLGDEVCEQLGAEADSIGFVFPNRSAACAARSRITNAVFRYHHGQ